jgi:hypothetical protein
MNKEEFNKLYETLKKSRFKQQKFPGWRPLPTISCITIIFISFGVFFVIFGIIILIFIGQLKEYKFRYDTNCGFSSTCTFAISILEEMKKPIMVYYQVNDVRQNHRFYMDNKSDKQLKGEEVSKDDLEKNNECENYLYNEDMGNNIVDANHPANDIAFPCGLIAKSFFRDELISLEMSGKTITLTTEELAYKSDIDSFSKVEYKTSHWLDISKEPFMIWSRIAPYKNPRKLWAKIEEDDIPSGTSITVTIKNNNYYTNEKYIILSTRNVFGGKSSFLGICYVVFGAFCLISAVIFINVFNYFHKKENI